MEILNNCCIFKMCHTVKDIFNDSEDIKPIESNNRSNISEITENLLLCGAIGIKPDVLKQLNITCVINAAPELPDTPLPEECTIYRRISVNDCRDSNISDYFDEVADLIEKVANDGGRTLVHCMAGISRSATLCIAYLMKHKNMCLKKAVLYVRQRRPIIMPNNGFFHQLIDYEKQLYGDNSMQMVFNEMFHMEMPDIYDKFYRKHTNRYIMRKIC